MTSRLPSLKPIDVVRALQRAGFRVHRTSGSHYLLKAEAAQRRQVVIPFHSREIKRGTLTAIMKQSGLSREDFLALL